MKKTDYKKYVDLAIKASKVLHKSKTIDLKKKEAFLAHASETILEYVFHEDININDFIDAKEFVENSITSFTKDEETFGLLKTLASCGDYTYAHSLACSM